MELEEAKALWASAPKRLAPDNEKHYSGEFTDYLEGGIPKWNRGKGGRVWCEVFLSIELMEALVVTGREQIPDEEIGYRWYRADRGVEDEALDEVVDGVEAELEGQPFDDSPMTPAEAEEVLLAKANGSFRPERPNALTREVVVDGETVLEELEAYLLLWKQARLITT